MVFKSNIAILFLTLVNKLMKILIQTREIDLRALNNLYLYNSFYD